MYQRILVAVDGSEPSERALESALQLASLANAQVRLVHVVDELDFVSGYGWAPDVLACARKQASRILESAEELARAAKVPTEAQLVEGPCLRLGEAIAEQARAWKADLVVAGTHGRRGVARAVLGSGAEQIIRLAPVPVLAVRSGDPMSCG